MMKLVILRITECSQFGNVSPTETEQDMINPPVYIYEQRN